MTSISPDLAGTLASGIDAMTSAIAGASVAVVGPTYINVDHPDYGGDVQAALDAHDAGTFYIPGNGEAREMAGVVRYRRHQSFVGDGKMASVLRWATSPGPGVTCFAPADPVGTYMHSTIRDLSVRGPRYGMDQPRGSAPLTDCYGIATGRRTELSNVLHGGFESGWVILADHGGGKNVFASHNHKNVRFAAVDNMWGDHYFENGDLSGAFLADFYVENGSNIAGSRFEGVHLGVAPYTFLAAPDRTTEQAFMIGNTFIDVPFEFFGNALVWSANPHEIGDIFADNLFLGCGASQDVAFQIPGVAYEYLFHANASNNRFVNFRWPTGDYSPGIAYFGSPDQGNFATGTILEQIPTSPITAPLFSRPDNAPPVLCTFTTQDASKGRVLRADGDVPAKTLVRPTSRDRCASLTDPATQVPAGAAMEAGTANRAIRVVKSGYQRLVSDAPIPGAGVPLKPSAETGAGRVAPAASWADGPIVGVSYGSATAAGSDVPAELWLGGVVG